MIGDSLGIDDIEFAQSGKQINGSETLGLIFGRMYFVPREMSTWLTGLGGSGRNWQFYILEADPGPTLNLHNLGIVGFLLIYIFFLKHLLFVVGNRNRCRLLWTAFLDTAIGSIGSRYKSPIPLRPQLLHDHVPVLSSVVDRVCTGRSTE